MEDDACEVSVIHYDVGAAGPNIQVVGVALKGDRTLFLELRMHRGVPLHHAAKELVAAGVEQLWDREINFAEAAD
jgi:spore cortex formation protein SpoVR/YcgB (stage V sporulation)